MTHNHPHIPRAKSLGVHSLYVQGTVMMSLLTLFESQQQCRIWGVAAEVAAALGVPEELILPQLEFFGPLQPADPLRGLKQVQQPTNHKRVVIQEAWNGRCTGENIIENISREGQDLLFLYKYKFNFC